MGTKEVELLGSAALDDINQHMDDLAEHARYLELRLGALQRSNEGLRARNKCLLWRLGLRRTRMMDAAAKVVVNVEKAKLNSAVAALKVIKEKAGERGGQEDVKVEAELALARIAGAPMVKVKKEEKEKVQVKAQVVSTGSAYYDTARSGAGFATKVDDTNHVWRIRNQYGMFLSKSGNYNCGKDAWNVRKFESYQDATKFRTVDEAKWQHMQLEVISVNAA